MTPLDIIDVGEYVRSLRKRRLRRIFRVIGPIFCLLVLIGAIAGIAATSYTWNRRDALALSNNLIRSLEDRVTAQVANYLTPVSDMARLAAGVLRNGAFNANRRDQVEPLAFEIFINYPQITAFNAGDPDGNFLMVKRMPDNSFHTKIITRNDTGTAVTWIRRDSSGYIVAFEHSADDTYDPRTRPWYTGALNVDDVHWTDAYIFFTDQKPGVTASKAVRGPTGQVLGVLSFDVLLQQLNTFLGDLNIGEKGQALIIDDKGNVVAMGEMGRALKGEGSGLRAALLKELGDRVLTQAFNRFRIGGHGIHQFIVDSQEIISTASPLSQTVGRDWSLLIVAPEDEVVGFVEQNTRRSLLMSAVVVAVASLLVGLLVWQGLRADHNAGVILENRRQFELQTQAFSELTNEVALLGTEDADTLVKLTEIVTRASGARRTSIWRLAGNGMRLVCEDAFDRESGAHSEGAVLNSDDFPDFFDAIFKGDEMVLSDAATDPRTEKLHRLYLRPLGCHALLSLPIRDGNEIAGGLWFEGQIGSRTWSPEDISFAHSIAHLLSLRLKIGKLTKPEKCENDFRSEIPRSGAGVDAPLVEGSKHISGHQKEVSSAGLITGGRKNRFYERLATKGMDRDCLAVDVFPSVTVFVVRFMDHLSMAKRTGKNSQATAMDYLVSHLERVAAEHEFDYLKVMGDEVIGAAGFTDEPVDRADSVADLALSFQDKCRQIFADLDAPMVFRIGVDTGPAIGCMIGEKREYYNLWGEAVAMARMMADAGVLGGIHVSDSTVKRLSARYLCKKRGAFYLEGSGEVQTYLLTGKL